MKALLGFGFGLGLGCRQMLQKAFFPLYFSFASKGSYTQPRSRKRSVKKSKQAATDMPKVLPPSGKAPPLKPAQAQPVPKPETPEKVEKKLEIPKTTPKKRPLKKHVLEKKKLEEQKKLDDTQKSEQHDTQKAGKVKPEYEEAKIALDKAKKKLEDDIKKMTAGRSHKHKKDIHTSAPEIQKKPPDRKLARRMRKAYGERLRAILIAGQKKEEEEKDKDKDKDKEKGKDKDKDKDKKKKKVVLSIDELAKMKEKAKLANKEAKELVKELRALKGQPNLLKKNVKKSEVIAEVKKKRLAWYEEGMKKLYTPDPIEPAPSTVDISLIKKKVPKLWSDALCKILLRYPAF